MCPDDLRTFLERHVVDERIQCNTQTANDMTHLDRKYTIGRALTCDVVLSDDSVSRIHAELTFLEDGKLLLTDCRSTQGSFLMDQSGEVRVIKQELVSARETLRFGSVSMPVKELLQAIHLKHPLVALRPPEGAGLVRCECGAVKVKNVRCEVCGT